MVWKTCRGATLRGITPTLRLISRMAPGVEKIHNLKGEEIKKLFAIMCVCENWQSSGTGDRIFKFLQIFKYVNQTSLPNTWHLHWLVPRTNNETRLTLTTWGRSKAMFRVSENTENGMSIFSFLLEWRTNIYNLLDVWFFFLFHYFLALM